MSGELQELGEEVDDNVQSISAMQTSILNLTHGKVNIFNDDGSFKSTYEIMKEISAIYYDLSDIDRASLLETIAGKNRASDVQSLINGWSQVEKATQAANNAEGSAMAEYSIHMDTVQASINELSSAWQEFSNIFLNEKVLSGGLDFLTDSLSNISGIIKEFGVLPTLLAGLSTINAFRGKGFFKTIEDEATVSGKRIVTTFANSFAELKSLSPKQTIKFTYSDVFNKGLKADKKALKDYVNAINNGMDRTTALSTCFNNASSNALKYASSTDVGNIKTREFTKNQRLAEIGLMGTSKNLATSKMLINEYSSGCKTCGVTQKQFLTAIQGTNPAMAKYLSGLNGAKGSLIGYIGTLITTEGATIGLTVATMALEAALTLGISVAISGLISWLGSLVNAQEKAREEAVESLNDTNDLVDKYNEEISTLSELTAKYKELNSASQTTDTRNQIAEVQKEIVGLVGSEADNLDLVGGKLEDNLAKLKEYEAILLKRKNNELKDKFEQTKKVNSMDDENEKTILFSKHDIVTGYNSRSVKLLERAGYDVSENIITNKMGVDADYNEFTGKDIESAKEALDYYTKMREDFIKELSKEYDGKLDDTYLEEVILKDNEFYGQLTDKIVELEKKTNEEKQLAQEIIQNTLSDFVTTDEELSKTKVKSAKDYEDYLNAVKSKILNDDFVQAQIDAGYFSEEDINAMVVDFVAGLDEIGDYTNKWIKEYGNPEVIFSFDSGDLDRVKSDLETFYAAISESSSTGLSSDTIDSLKNMYSSLDGYDATALFEHTTLGIKLNREELKKLQNQYEEQNFDALEGNLKRLYLEYDNLTYKIKNCKDEQEKARLTSQRDNVSKQIDGLNDLQSSLQATTSAYYEWQQALSTENEGAGYDAYTDNLKSLKELYSKGLIGTDDFQSGVQLMTNEDLSGKTAQEIASVYESKLPTIQKFFKEGTSGCQNFLNAVQNINEEWAKQNKDGSWELNFDNEALANELGVSVDLVELLVNKLIDFGFEIDRGLDVDNMKSFVDYAQKAVDEFNSLNDEAEDVKFNFEAKSVKEANVEIKKAKDLLNGLKSEDGKLNLDSEQVKKAQTILEATIRRKQMLERPAVLDIDTSNLEKDTAEVVALLTQLSNYANDLEVAIGTGDTEGANNLKVNIDKTIKSLVELSNKSESVKNTVGANISAIAKLGTDDFAGLQKAVSSITPDMVAKIDTAEVDKFLKKDISKESNITYDLRKTKQLENFMNNPPSLRGTITYTPSASSYAAISSLPLALKVNGTANVNGTTSRSASGSIKNGRAFVNGKRGDWSIGSSGTALVGELGAEILVRNGEYTVIGNNGAEFIDYQPNDINKIVSVYSNVYEKFYLIVWNTLKLFKLQRKDETNLNVNVAKAEKIK